MYRRDERPVGVAVVAVLLAIFGFWAVFAGGYWFGFSIASDDPIIHGLAKGTITGLGVLSATIGILYVIAAERLWTLKEWAWHIGVFASVFGIVATLAAHIITGRIILIVLSWFYPLVAVAALIVLYLPDVREYYTGRHI